MCYLDCRLSVSIYWDYALTVPLRQIVCIHCHQRREYNGCFPTIPRMRQRTHVDVHRWPSSVRSALNRLLHFTDL